MSNLRTVSVIMTNNTTEANPAVMTITNATAQQGQITTPSTDFPINIVTNGGQGQVDGEATSSREGITGQANYVVQEIRGSAVKFSNTQSARSTSFQIGNGGPSVELKDNGDQRVQFGGFTWYFQTTITNLSYVINVTIS
jgi:hypothetical protein